jgi:translation elongation factor EF-4
MSLSQGEHFYPHRYIGSIMDFARIAGACIRIPSTSTPTEWSCTTSCRSVKLTYDFFEALKARTKGYARLNYIFRAITPQAG